MGLWNKKGVIISGLSMAIAAIVGSKLEDGLQKKFNPELVEARNDFKDACFEAIKPSRSEESSSEIFASRIDVETTATEEETSE